MEESHRDMEDALELLRQQEELGIVEDTDNRDMLAICRKVRSWKERFESFSKASLVRSPDDHAQCVQALQREAHSLYLKEN